MTLRPLLLVLLVSAVGCDTVSDRVDQAACAASGYADAGTVTATVSGSRYATACVRVDRESGVVTVASIDNVVSNQAQRLLAITVPATVGTYAIGSSTAAGVYTTRAADASDQAEQTYVATSGTVTVTSTGSGAAGTFSFAARTPAGAQIEVTAGRFDVTD